MWTLPLTRPPPQSAGNFAASNRSSPTVRLSFPEHVKLSKPLPQTSLLGNILPSAPRKHRNTTLELSMTCKALREICFPCIFRKARYCAMTVAGPDNFQPLGVQLCRSSSPRLLLALQQGRGHGCAGCSAMITTKKVSVAASYHCPS